MKENIRIEPDRTAVGSACASLFVDQYRAAVASRGRFVVALAGGSSPAPMHAALASSPLRESVNWSRIWVIYGDERCVPFDHADSNHGAAERSLLSLVSVPDTQILRMPAQHPDPVAGAVEYEHLLDEKLGSVVDLICLGIGKDAHIFSLFPGCSDIAHPRGRIVGLVDPPMNPARSRISATGLLLDRASRIVVMAAGADKSDALRRVFEGDETATVCPGKLLLGRSNVAWIIDREAARGLRTSEPSQL